jgi:hypothetical protein
MTNGYTPEGPFVPDLAKLLNEIVNKHEDDLTNGQIVRRQTLTRAIDYIHKTKTVINSLHEIIELHKEVQKQQKELLRHCAAYIREPKTRNKDLILKAIEQHLGSKP